jgi:N6-adenosine-specific RNA methylase IME4
MNMDILPRAGAIQSADEHSSVQAQISTPAAGVGGFANVGKDSCAATSTVDLPQFAQAVTEDAPSSVEVIRSSDIGDAAAPCSPRQFHHQVIYADPPWYFQNYSPKGEGRNPVVHYDCMSLDQLVQIPVREWAAKDATLLMWATDPMLPSALKLIEAWGFEYKTVGFYWVKLNKKANLAKLSRADFFTGCGYWTRANGELCLLATKGKPKRLSKRVRRLIVSPRREHSRKPDEAYERIEELVDGPYLELFARNTRSGWESWGDQVALFDNGAPPTRRNPSKLTSTTAA